MIECYRDISDYFVIAAGIGFAEKLLDEVSLHITTRNEILIKYVGYIFINIICFTVII